MQLLRGHPCSMLVCAQPIEGGFGRPWTMIMYTRHKEVLVDSCETKQTCQWISLLSMLHHDWLAGNLPLNFPREWFLPWFRHLKKSASWWLYHLVCIYSGSPRLFLIWPKGLLIPISETIVSWEPPKNLESLNLQAISNFLSIHGLLYIWVFPKIGGTPKWMVYNGNPIQMDDLGVPPFTETPIWCLYHSSSARVYLFSPSNRCSVSQGGSDSFWELHRKLGERSFVCNALRCISGSMYHMGTHSFIFGVFQPRTRWIKKQTLSVFQLESLINIILKKPIGVT